ncbi:MAG: hypothetical protein Satyrvirus11_20 [Satyrvirus sp.]|uniref:Uncharacterized protein n=1 Tax=Satyrvirus sp. TaxID=2487771 RepID=A0A3G5ADY9_9VIRU|nr:MAG: hypothetical protein Satyrvirus11_20 [Satyrvirus sp.]
MNRLLIKNFRIIRLNSSVKRYFCQNDRLKSSIDDLKSLKPCIEDFRKFDKKADNNVRFCDLLNVINELQYNLMLIFKKSGHDRRIEDEIEYYYKILQNNKIILFGENKHLENPEIENWKLKMKKEREDNKDNPYYVDKEFIISLREKDKDRDKPIFLYF